MTSPSTVGSDAIVAPVQGDYLAWKDKVISHAKTSGDTTTPQPPPAPSETALVPKGQTKLPTSTATDDDITKACLSLVGEPAAVADFLAWEGTAGSARLAADTKNGALSCYYSVYGNKDETLQVTIQKATPAKPGTTDGNPAVNVDYTYPMSSMDGYQMHAWMDRIAKATTT